MKINQTSKFYVDSFKEVVVCVTTAKVSFTGVKDLEVTARGIARCAPEDLFDQKKGEMLAESRATSKLYRKIQTVKKVVDNRIKRALALLEEDNAKLTTLIKTEEDHYQSLL